MKVSLVTHLGNQIELSNGENNPTHKWNETETVCDDGPQREAKKAMNSKP
jgi:hypothetical protein